MRRRLKVGDLAPDFRLPDQHGGLVRLTELLRRGRVVVFFYPAAMTPGCTAESCHFRDLAGEFAAAGALRVGISGDGVQTQHEFDAQHGLGYPLLSDADGAVAAAYGLRRAIRGLPPQRATFVIDTDRRVLGVIASELRMEVHADGALTLLHELGPAAGGGTQTWASPPGWGRAPPCLWVVRRVSSVRSRANGAPTCSSLRSTG